MSEEFRVGGGCKSGVKLETRVECGSLNKAETGVNLRNLLLFQILRS